MELTHEQKSSFPNTFRHGRSLSSVKLSNGILDMGVDVGDAAYVADDNRITKVTQSDSFMITNVPQGNAVVMIQTGVVYYPCSAIPVLAPIRSHIPGLQ